MLLQRLARVREGVAPDPPALDASVASVAGAATAAAVQDRFGSDGIHASAHAPSAEVESTPVAVERPRVPPALLEQAAVVTRQQAHGPVDASWFSGVSDGESTYDADAVDRATVAEPAGQDVETSSPFAAPDVVKSPEWFQESRSGGPQSAWQTFYPALPSVHRGGLPPPPWLKNERRIGYMQDYARDSIAFHANEALSKDAEWFDSTVAQYDAFGRPRAPSEASERFFVDWAERRRSAAIACQAPGCTGSATLEVFNASEEHRGCVLSIAIHPTDFGDEFSTEVVEWFSANGRIVSKNCNPKVSGCNPLEAAQLFSCASEVNVDHLLNGSGTLEVAGKLSPMVDECPVDGNLLSGVVTMRCLVRPRQKVDSPLPPPQWPMPEPPKNETRASATLRCRTPGCEAISEIALTPPAGNATCWLALRIRQTDFDGEVVSADGVEEEVEWVRIDNRTVRSHSKPGRNPCKEAKNRSLTQADGVFFSLLQGEDVTEKAMRGPFNVSVKISDMVDECGSPEGDLLDAIATVTCNTLPPSASVNVTGARRPASGVAGTSGAASAGPAEIAPASAGAAGPAPASPSASEDSAPETSRRAEGRSPPDTKAGARSAPPIPAEMLPSFPEREEPSDSTGATVTAPGGAPPVRAAEGARRGGEPTDGARDVYGPLAEPSAGDVHGGGETWA